MWLLCNSITDYHRLQLSGKLYSHSYVSSATLLLRYHRLIPSRIKWNLQQIPSKNLSNCWPELALGQPRITDRPCVSCVCCCVSVLTGIELCNWWTDFKTDLVTCYCYCLVVISRKWKKIGRPLYGFRGASKIVPIIVMESMERENYRKSACWRHQ